MKTKILLFISALIMYFLISCNKHVSRETQNDILRIQAELMNFDLRTAKQKLWLSASISGQTNNLLKCRLMLDSLKNILSDDVKILLDSMTLKYKNDFDSYRKNTENFQNFNSQSMNESGRALITLNEKVNKNEISEDDAREQLSGIQTKMYRDLKKTDSLFEAYHHCSIEYLIHLGAYREVSSILTHIHKKLNLNNK